MEDMRNIHRRIILFMGAALFIIICSIYVYFIVNTSRVYEEHAVESLIEGKKDFLKSTVDNMILEIKLTQETQKRYYKTLTDHRSKMLKEYYGGSLDIDIDLFINYCQESNYKEAISVSIEDQNLGQVIYEGGIFKDNNPGKEDFLIYSEENYGEYKIVSGVSKDYFHNKVKQTIADNIHRRKFAQNSYIWVNEIRDYSGGDDYAVRIIHPNLVHTQGQFLSTNTQDIMGNYPYKEELEGIKKDGQLFSNYYFIKKDSDTVSEKITYARLYQEYDWVIAMGVHVDDIEAYIATTLEDRKQIIKKTIAQIIIMIILLFTLYGGIIWHLERRFYRNYNKRLEQEIYMDSLTKTKNRKAAAYYLDKAFKVFKQTGETPMIMLIDVDDFKKVNDTYGHNQGDMVLQSVVQLINNNIRSTDTLYRWGGEEFLLVCKGLKKKNVIDFSNKIISVVGEKEYDFNGKKYHTTISVGIDQFIPTDKTYQDAINRSDMAMYKAKSLGKNRACLGNMCGGNPLNN